MTDAAILVVFGGLPGTGKTTLARLLSQHLNGVYLRIDTIEQVLKKSDGIKVGDEGYQVAYAVAADNLRMGNTVIADSVNPIPVTRDAWRNVAKRAGARLIEVEVICSDKQEHQRRVERRETDIPGLKLPSWQEVQGREYHPWEGCSVVIDTSQQSEEKSLQALIQKISVFGKAA